MFFFEKEIFTADVNGVRSKKLFPPASWEAGG